MEKSVTLRKSWIDLASLLPSDEDRLRLYNAVFQYAFCNIAPELPCNITVIFQLIKLEIDKAERNRKAVKRTRAKQAENQKVNESPNDDLQADYSNISHKNNQESKKIKEKNPLENPLLKENKENVIQTAPARKGKEPEHLDLIPEHLRTETFTAVWIEWEKYRRKTKRCISPHAAKMQLEMLSQYSEADAVGIIRTSITNDWQGLFPPNNRPVGTSPAPVRKDYTKL